MSKIKKYGKEKIQNLLNEKDSYNSILIEVGLQPRGSNGATLQKYIKEWNLNTSLFEENCKQRNISDLNKVRNEFSVDEIFCENSKYVSITNRMKTLLQEEFGFEYKCSICGIDSWQDEKISLQLDHINGINDDNRVENVRFLCPNCHSQTDTFAGKNVKHEINPKRICECGNKKSRQAPLCKECTSRRQSEDLSNIPITKEELIAKLKETSFVKVGKLYDVSDNAVRRWCVKYGIPRTKKEINKL